MLHSVRFLLASLIAVASLAQNQTRFWNARWIETPGTSPHGYGVYHFRKTVELSAKPQRFVIDVSGDNRYQLYVNGRQVSFGPARGDLSHWRYEVVDIAAQLEAGKNVLAAVVWNDGPDAAIAQVTNRTGFVLNAEAAGDAAANSNSSWKCMPDLAYSPLPIPSEQRTGY